MDRFRGITTYLTHSYSNTWVKTKIVILSEAELSTEKVNNKSMTTLLLGHSFYGRIKYDA